MYAADVRAAYDVLRAYCMCAAYALSAPCMRRPCAAHLRCVRRLCLVHHRFVRSPGLAHRQSASRPVVDRSRARKIPWPRMFRGACDIVTGAIALPFAALDCILENEPCGPRAGLARLRLRHVVLLRSVCRRCAVPDTVLHMAWVRADDRWELAAMRLGKWSRSQSASPRESSYLPVRRREFSEITGSPKLIY